MVAALLALPCAGGGSAAQVPRRGGTVVLGVVPEPLCLTLIDACTANTALWIWDEVLPGAFAIAPDLTLRPQLVSDVKYSRTPPFTLTYHLRRQARWSDGVPVTAADFVFTHQAVRRLVEPGTPDPHLQVRAIRALDRKTVRVVLRSRMANWRELFAHVLPWHALAGEDLRRIWTTGINNPKTGRPIGSGPFLVAKWEPGKQLTLSRNSRYWGQHVARLERVILRFCQEGCKDPPAEALATLRSGVADIVLNREPAIVADLRRIPGISVLVTPSNGWEHLALRVGAGGHPALRQKLVRQALAYGIDRVAIARELFGNLDANYPPSDSAVFLNTSRHYKATWGSYRYRPAVARRLLAQAGCVLGQDGIYLCAGRRLSLRVRTIAGSQVRQRTVELIQSQLRQAGVEVLLDFAPGVTFIQQVLPSGDFDAAAFAWFGGDALADKELYDCGGAQNFMGYCQRLVTSDFDEAERILDTEARAVVLHRVDRRLANDVPVIPLYQIPFVIASRKELRNVVPGPFNPLWKAEDWWLER
jgi:peptide/nickel transport system substrate-binding protein